MFAGGAQNAVFPYGITEFVKKKLAKRRGEGYNAR